MSRTRVRSVYMTNVMYPTTKEKLKQFLLEHFNEFFAEAHRTKDLKVDLYPIRRTDVPPGDIKYKCSAVVSGMRVIFEDLEAAAKALNQRMRAERKWWANVYFKRDSGEERTDLGDRVKEVNPEEAKMYAYLRGKPVTPMRLFTHRDFPDDFRPVFQERALLGLEKEVLAEDIDAVTIVDAKIGRPKAKFESALACFQSMARFNQVNTEKYGRIVFTHERTGEKCEMVYGHYLGVDGKMNFEEIQAQKGYIPFRMFEEDVIDVFHYRSMPGKCIKCGQNYLIGGLDKDLRYAAGKCKCDYTLHPLDPKGAIRFPGESFTRLHYCVGKDNNYEKDFWTVVFPPMKDCYENPKEYREIVEPMLRWEFQERVSHMEAFFTLRVDKICRVIPVGGYEKEHREMMYKYFVIIQTRMTSIWQQSSLVDIEMVTASFMMNTTQNYNYKTAGEEQVKCDHLWINDDNDKGLCNIYLTVNLPASKEILPEYGATIRAQKKFQIFRECLDFLEFWEDGFDDSPFLRLVLDPDSVAPIVDIRNVRFSYGELVRQAHDKVLKSLNPDQAKALDMIKTRTFSQVWGPPGTGKTFVAAVAIISMACNQRSRKILALSPTNFGSHALKSALEKIFSTHFSKVPFPEPILLVSHKAQEDLEVYKDFSTDFPETPVRVLHFEVQKEIKKGIDIRLQQINQHKFRRNCGPILEADHQYWTEQVAIIRDEIMRAHPIHIWSMDAAMEKKFDVWRNANVDCVVVDEAGSLPQAFFLPILQMKAKRFVHIGDYKQLRCAMQSRSCEFSGLAISQMEWKNLSPNKIPETLLTTQYRMAPSICKVVSEYSYSSKLITSPTVNPKLEEPLQRALGMREDNHILVVNHWSDEEKTFMGIQNPNEVDVVEKIWGKLEAEQIDPERVAVLTFYTAQKKILEKSSKLQGLKIELVDAMQGSERDIVIVSMVRSNDKVGGVKHQNRLNVMMSRAKCMLILVMNTWTFESVSTKSLRTLMRLLKEHAVFKEVEEL